MEVATVLLSPRHVEAAERLSTILAGTPPREVQGHLVFDVPLDRVMSALLFDVDSPRALAA